MTRKRFPRISIGNGSYCYAGPHCKLHGTPQTMDSIAYDTRKLQKEAKTALDSYIHENNITVKALEELGEDALLTGQGAQWCVEHDAYHVYSTQNALNTPSKISGSTLKQIGEYIRAGILTKEQASGFRNQLSNIVLNSRFKAEYAEHKQTMTEFQKHFRNADSPEAKAAAAARAEQQEEARRKSIRVAAVKEFPPAEVDEKTVPDATILEYWQCGRKKQFASKDEGDEHIKIVREVGEMDAYKCSHCPEWHVGHGGGLDSVESQISRARVHWMENGHKSNVFAFRKGLI